MKSIFYVIVTLTLSQFATGKSNIEQKILPSATLTWEEALLAQLRLLHKGDMRGCFAFANKESTGGLENFENMLRIYYSTTVDSEWYTEQPIPSRSTATSACALVLVGKGSRVDKFEWCLSQQSGTASCPKCWMTDSVMPVDGSAVVTATQNTASRSTAEATTSAITEPVTSEATGNGGDQHIGLVPNQLEQHLQLKTSKPHRPSRPSEEQAKSDKQHGHHNDENGNAHHPGDHTYHKSNQRHYHDHHDNDNGHHHGDHDYHHGHHRGDHDHHRGDKDYHRGHHHHDDNDHGRHHDGNNSHHHGHHHDHHHDDNDQQEEKVVHETKTLSQPVKILLATLGLTVICSLVVMIFFFCCKLRRKGQARIAATEVALTEELDRGGAQQVGITLDVDSSKPADDDDVVLVVAHGRVQDGTSPPLATAMAYS